MQPNFPHVGVEQNVKNRVAKESNILFIFNSKGEGLRVWSGWKTQTPLILLRLMTGKGAKFCKIGRHPSTDGPLLIHNTNSIKKWIWRTVIPIECYLGQSIQEWTK